MPNPKAFRLNDEDIALLDKVSEALGCSQTDAVRWGLAALRALLHDGDDAWQAMADGRRLLTLRLGPGVKAITLFERKDGGGTFAPGGESGPAYWGDEPRDANEA